MKELTLVTQTPHVPTLLDLMSAPATLVTMEMEETVQVSHAITLQLPVICEVGNITENHLHLGFMKLACVQ